MPVAPSSVPARALVHQEGVIALIAIVGLGLREGGPLAGLAPTAIGLASSLSLGAVGGALVSVVDVDRYNLVPVGQPRRDFRQLVEGDGWVVVRHPDFETTVELSDYVATHLRMYAE